MELQDRPHRAWFSRLVRAAIRLTVVPVGGDALSSGAAGQALQPSGLS